MKVNIVAPVNSLGYGTVGLNLIKSAFAAGDEPAWWPMGGAEAPDADHPLLMRANEAAKFFDRDAPSLRVWHQFDLAQHVGKRLHAALPIFELDRFTDQELHQLRSQDAVIAPSSWGARVLLDAGIKNVSVAPFGVDASVFSAAPAGDDVILPDEQLVLRRADETVFFNVGKWEVRKGHDVLIEAFSAAFTPGDNVRLVLCCHNPFLGEAGNAEWARMAATSRMGRAGRVTVVPRRLPEQRNVAALLRACDVGVFPARAEGWNLDLLEAMACGKHVVATAYSAHTEYVDGKNCWLVEPDGLEDAFDGVWFKGQGRWMAFGERQFEQLVGHMRALHRMKQSGQLSAPNAAGVETSRRFTWAGTWSHVRAALGA